MTLAFLPSVSSNLNPVERLWNLVKSEWSKVLVQQALTQSEMPRVLLHIVSRIGKDVIQGVNRSSHKLMKHVLEGRLV